MDSLLAGISTGTPTNETLEDYNDNEDVFQPWKGNVILACALDGWGFGYRDEEDGVLERLKGSAVA